MDFASYVDGPAQTAVDLVNSYDAFSGQEYLSTPDDLAGFLARHAGDFHPPKEAITERDLHDVRVMRDRVREVFEAGDDDAAVAIVNEILADVSSTPQLSVRDSHPHLHIEPATASPAQWLGAVAALGLAVAIIDGGFQRLGVCDASKCRDVYVDTSRNRSRRFCSTTCTTRENVAAYRERQRSG